MTCYGDRESLPSSLNSKTRQPWKGQSMLSCLSWGRDASRPRRHNVELEYGHVKNAGEKDQVSRLTSHLMAVALLVVSRNWQELALESKPYVCLPNPR